MRLAVQQAGHGVELIDYGLDLEVGALNPCLDWSI